MNPLHILGRYFRTSEPPSAAKPQPRQKRSQAERYGRVFYSQEGEDCILNAIFRHRKEGFYVDVGAHHPFRFSNTAMFYERGWRGLNIDATPGSMAPFDEHRPRDINVEAVVSDQKRQSIYYLFSDAALNTLDGKRAEQLLHLPDSPYKLRSTIEIETQTLASLLDRHLPAEQHIDFLNIDVEHHDLEVLRSNSWEIYRPDVLVCEVNEHKTSALTLLLGSLDYHLIAKTPRTGIFAGEQFWQNANLAK